MAIILDASSVSTDQTSSPLTWNHTVTTGSNTLLVVGVFVSSATPQPTTTAVTYNGVAMTKAVSKQVTGATALTEVSIWILANPTTGTNQVSATISSSGLTPHFGGASTSYMGVQQSSVADAFGSTSGSTTGAKTLTFTTSAQNAWIFALGSNIATTGPTLTATQTLRESLSLGSVVASVIATEDTNGPLASGSNTVGFTTGATAGEDAFAIVGASFGPQLTIQVTDNTTTSENMAPQSPGFAGPYFGSAYFGGSPYVNNATVIEGTLSPQIAVSDTTSHTESLSIFLSGASVNVSDTTVTSESVTIAESSTIIAVSDTEGPASESVTVVKSATIIAVSDTTSHTESLTIIEGTAIISVSDTEGPASESVTVIESATIIQVSDTTSHTESIVVAESSTIIAVSDTEGAATENITIRTDENPYITDTTVTSESVTLQTQEGIYVTDSTITSESVVLVLPEILIAVSDTTVTSESVFFTDIDLPYVSDTTVTSENVMVSAPSLYISNEYLILVTNIPIPIELVVPESESIELMVE